MCCKQLLAPTALLKPQNRSQYKDDSPYKTVEYVKGQSKKQTTITAEPLAPPHKAAEDYNWDVVDEYDPLWPNEYEKLIKERRERRENDRKRRSTRTNDQPSSKYSGFGNRSDDAETYNKSPPTRSGGAAIAPPPSLQESTPIIPPQNASSAYPGSVAAKIMAKYGFKDGQGLGKQEQGMAAALQVEKTSKRGGRIIHEKEFVAPSTSPPPPAIAFIPPPAAAFMPPPAVVPSAQTKEEQTITQMMKAPSKVVLLRVRILFPLHFASYWFTN